MKFRILKDRQSRHSEVAAALVEMALLIALIAVIAIPSVSWIGEGVEANVTATADALAAGGAYHGPCDDQHPEWPACLE